MTTLPFLCCYDEVQCLFSGVRKVNQPDTPNGDKGLKQDKAQSILSTFICNLFFPKGRAAGKYLSNLSPFRVRAGEVLSKRREKNGLRCPGSSGQKHARFKRALVPYLTCRTNKLNEK